MIFAAVQGLLVTELAAAEIASAVFVQETGKMCLHLHCSDDVDSALFAVDAAHVVSEQRVIGKWIDPVTL